MDPSRDLAHAFPEYLMRAASILEHGPLHRFFKHFEDNGGNPDDVGAVIRFWQRYFEHCNSAEHATQASAFNASGFEELDLDAVGTASTSLMFVLLSAYFKGLREATFSSRPQENPTNQMKLPEHLYLRPTTSPIRRWIRSQVYGLFRIISNVI